MLQHTFLCSRPASAPCPVPLALHCDDRKHTLCTREILRPGGVHTVTARASTTAAPAAMHASPQTRR